MGSNAILVLLLSRVFLTPEEFGRLFFALSVVGVVSILAALGLPKSTARYVTEYVEKDPSQVPHILRRSLLYLSILVAVVAVTFAVASGWLAEWLGDPALAPFLLVGATYVVVYAYSGYVGTLFQAFNQVTWSAVLNVISGVGRFVFAVGFVLAGLGALGALLGYVAGYGLAACVGAIVLYRRYRSRFEPADEVESGLLRRLIEYSVPLTATRSAGVIDKKIDTVLVGMLLNPTAVGYYVIAKQVSDIVVSPAGSFGYTISPAIGEQNAGDRVDRAAELYQQSLRFVLLFYVPAAVGLALVAEPTIRFVFGAAYLPAVPVLQVLGAFVLVSAITKITSNGLDYLGRARSRAIAKGVMAVSNVLLNLLLIPLLGVVGAAVATVITYGAYTITNVYIIHLELSLDLGRLIHTVSLVFAITLGMVLSIVLVLPYVSSLVSLLGVVLFGAIVWMGLSVVTGLLELRRVAAVLA